MVFTFTPSTASLAGQQSCDLCLREVWQTTQIGSSSTMQKSLSLSSCKGHISPGGTVRSRPDSHPSTSASSTHDWHRFFRVRLGTGSSVERLRHRGHSRLPPRLQYSRRQAAQKLWLHLRTTGSLKISQQMGQDRSTSESDSRTAIMALMRLAAGETVVSVRGGASTGPGPDY